MYQVNRLNRNVLITPAEVQFFTDLKEGDVRNLWAYIPLAEERFVRKMLCRDLYDDLRTLKNIIVTEGNKDELTTKINAGNTGQPLVLKVNTDRVNSIDEVPGLWYQALWYEYLGKICAECVLYVSTPSRWLQSSASGEMLNNPQVLTPESQTTASGELKDVKWKMDKMLMDRIDPLIEGMKEYLCINKVNFPKFNCYTCPEEDKSGVSYKRKTDWIHGIYDREEKDCSINNWD